MHYRGHVALPESTDQEEDESESKDRSISAVRIEAWGDWPRGQHMRLIGAWATMEQLKSEYEEDSEQTILEVGPDGSLEWFFYGTKC